MNNNLIITVGNIGTGKSTYVRKINDDNKYYVVNSDNLVRMFCSGEYNFDDNKKSIYYVCMYSMIKTLLRNNQNVIIDNPNLTVMERRRIIKFAKKYDTEYILCVDFGKGNNESLNRRLKNSRKIADEIWRNVHDVFQNKYEKPSLKEGFTNITKMY